MYKSLAENEVFVFGSNENGFHGAGAAGFACRGTHENTWRQDAWFLKALRSPTNSPDRIGKWAILGCPEGFQVGTEGKSYAIVTIKRPGLKRSVPLKQIKQNIEAFMVFATINLGYKFLVSEIACGNAGYSPSEIAPLFLKSPNNVYLPQSFIDFNNKCLLT